MLLITGCARNFAADMTRAYAKFGIPTSAQLELIGLKIPMSTGHAVYRRPVAIDLLDPVGYTFPKLLVT